MYMFVCVCVCMYVCIVPSVQIHQEKPPVRWQPVNEERGRPIRDNTDVEGGTLGWSTGGKEKGRLSPRDEMQETATATSPKRPQKLKIDIQDDTPPVRRRSISRTTEITSL
jgi:hypothetical protein